MIQDTNLTIMIKDMDLSIGFYIALGFELKGRWGNHYAQLTAPGITIGLHPTTAGKLAANSGNVSIGFTTDDFDKAMSHLAGLGIKSEERKEEGGKFLHFSDPDGTALYFYKI